MLSTQDAETGCVHRSFRRREVHRHSSVPFEFWLAQAAPMSQVNASAESSIGGGLLLFSLAT
jgi:hypothetical protein